MNRVSYSPEIVEKVCELLHTGMSLRVTLHDGTFEKVQ